MSKELQNAIKARDEFLEKHPKMKSYQEEIDRLLDGSGDSQGRMAVLGMMMQCKLVEMQTQLIKLSSTLSEAVQAAAKQE